MGRGGGVAEAGRFATDGFNGVMGLQIVVSQKDRVVGELQADHRHVTAGGRIHGGVLMAFADALGACGTVLNLPDGTSTSTIESKTNFLSAAQPGMLTGVAVPLHRGRSTMVWQTTIHDEDGDRVAIVTQTQIVLPRRGDESQLSSSQETHAKKKRPGG